MECEWNPSFKDYSVTLNTSLSEKQKNPLQYSKMIKKISVNMLQAFRDLWKILAEQQLFMDLVTVKIGVLMERLLYG